ncbi:MAG: deoxyribose-phosphate aldolase [Actinomycetota bacterium]
MLLRCLDLTSLNENDTAEQIAVLCERAKEPAPGLPSVAAVCIAPEHVSKARKALFGTTVHVGTVNAFPDGKATSERRVADITKALGAGAQEIDTVLSPSALVPGREKQAIAELKACRKACDGGVILKVILETGRAADPGWIKPAALLAMRAGCDFIKSSTGLLPEGATIPAVRQMMEAVGQYDQEAGHQVGIKVAGGIRKAEHAQRYLDLLVEELGPSWARPERFRIGSSSLLDDLLQFVD